jgi:hypothetical protein
MLVMQEDSTIMGGRQWWANTIGALTNRTGRSHGMADAIVFYEGPIVSRAEALRAGAKFFFSGKPCNKGHIALRYVKRGCVICSEEQRNTWMTENAERHKKLQADWYKANREHHAAYGRKWRTENPEKSRAICDRWKADNRDRYLAARKARRQAASNKETSRQYDRKRYHEKRKLDPAYRVHMKIRGEISRYLKRRSLSKGGRSWETLVGYTRADLVARLKQTIPVGYTWQDYLDGKLHIDHITPCVAFNVTSADDIDFRRCWSLKNLQLLPVSENCSKGATLAQPFQPSFSGI